MAFGDRVLERGSEGADVQELQVRLAGFRGTIPDGAFGPGTELQVVEFQRDFMDMGTPDGVVGAVDLDVLGTQGEDRHDDMRHCDRIRGLLVEHAHAQVGWAAPNRKALEPSSIAPTWAHYDVRCYASKYLKDPFFCTTAEELDGESGTLMGPTLHISRETE